MKPVAAAPAQGRARASALAAAARDPARLPGRDRALLILVASYGSSKPRVALVDEDNLPVDGRDRRPALPRRPHDRRGEQERRTSCDSRRRRPTGSFRTARSSPAVTVPPGFVATLRGMVASPKLQVELSHGTISSRVEPAGAGARLLAQPPAPAGLHRQQPPVRGPDPARAANGSVLGRQFNVLGLERSQRLLERMPPDPGGAEPRGLHRTTRGSALADTGDAMRAIAPPDRDLVHALRAGARAALSAEVQAYTLAVTITLPRRCCSRPARSPPSGTRT